MSDYGQTETSILKDAIKSALKGGISGSIAQASNVVMFMWLRSAMTNQVFVDMKGYGVIVKF